MACYHPLKAFQCDDGRIVFVERAGHHVARSLLLPCGQCVGCRLERSRQWAVRCMNEASLYDSNCFVSLTYSPEFVPEFGSLRYSDFQLFMKRLRGRFSPVRVRFYMCGEYGEDFGRPHFHACLFNLDFPDKVYFAKSAGGCKLYRSRILEDLWPHGFSSVGTLTFESAAYVARYCMKKVTGPRASRHYDVVNTESGEIVSRVPEFNHMSLKPGVGAEWLRKFTSDVYPHGKILVRGHECKPPRYYDKIFEKLDGFAFDDMQYGRYLEGLARAADNTDARLADREAVAKARLSMLKRSI